jgi:hypothetical protein
MKWGSGCQAGLHPMDRKEKNTVHGTAQTLEILWVNPVDRPKGLSYLHSEVDGKWLNILRFESYEHLIDNCSFGDFSDFFGFSGFPHFGQTLYLPKSSGDNF